VPLQHPAHSPRRYLIQTEPKDGDRM
jgi:hypothetical protein